MKTRQLVIVGILIIAIVAMIAPVMSADTTAVSGNPTAYVVLAVSSETISMTLTPGGTVHDTTAHLTVSSNCPYTIAAKDAMTESKPSAGYMVNYTGTEYKTDKLAATMGISGTESSPVTTTAIAPLTAANQVLYTSTGGVQTAKELALSFDQAVAITDPRLPAGHSYKIPVTFTITGS